MSSQSERLERRFACRLLLAGSSAALLLSACDVDLERMIEQHKYEAFEPSSIFADGKVMREPPRGTVPTNAPVGSPELLQGLEHGQDGAYVTRIPLELSSALLDRGNDRFQIFCQPCHGALGDAKTKIADAMPLRHPASLQEDRIKALPVGAVYRVIGEGYGLMPSYAAQLTVEDRWAVVAYVKALELSQDIKLAELPASMREEARTWLQ